MKEKVEQFVNSFKTGIIFWLMSYFLLYLIGVYIGDVSDYNAEIMKLLNVKNFISQVLIVGVTYVALSTAFVYYSNNVVKIISLNVECKRKIVKETILMIIILSVLLPVLYVVKEHNIVNKNIIKLMVSLIIFKTMIFCIGQIINTHRYNKKLQEKNKK